MSAVSVFSAEPRQPPRSVETGLPDRFVLEATDGADNVELRVRTGGVSPTAQKLDTLLEAQKQQAPEHQRFFTEMRTEQEFTHKAGYSNRRDTESENRDTESESRDTESEAKYRAASE
jgi:hypothetical protein